MKFSVAAIALSFAASVAAVPSSCISSKGATQLINNFAAVMMNQSTSLGSAVDTAQAILARGYYEVSDSVESLMNDPAVPLGTIPTSKGKQAIIKSLGEHPIGQVTTLKLLVAGCDTIVWYWLMNGVGISEQEVKGINIMTVNQKGQLASNHFEFNSIAWGTDTFALPAQCYAGSSTATGTSTGIDASSTPIASVAA